MTSTAHISSKAGPKKANSGQRRAIGLGLLISAQFVVMLDTSIVNVALPSIQTDLGLNATGLSWIVNAYVLTFGGLLLLLGRVADLLGRRRMFIIGSAAFTFGTLVAATSGHEWMLIAGRVIQGAGAAALSPAAMSLLMQSFPGEQRPRAMSLWGAASAMGGATGVLAGGLLTGAFGWPSVFLVTVPPSLAAVALARRVLDDTGRATRRPFDALGAFTITTAVIALVHGALGASERGLSPSTLIALTTSAIFMVAFIGIERRALDPLVPLELFRSPSLSLGVWLAVLGGAARASTFVLIALYLQKGLSMSPAHAGLAMVPTSVAGFVVNLTLLPRVLRALGALRSMVVGLGILAGGQMWIAYAPTGLGYGPAVLPGLVLVAIGVALSFTPTTMVIAAAAPTTHIGLAAGLASSATQVGAALGTAIFTAIALAAGKGFTAAFTVAALVALTTAGFASLLARRGSGGE